MRQAQGFSGIVMGGAISLLATQPVWAATAQVTAVRLNPQESGLKLTLETQSGDKRPEVLTVNRGNDWVADIVNTRLSLSEGDSFRQENPMPGITSVLVSQLDANNVRVTVSGASSPPTGQILPNEGQGITLGINTDLKNQAAVSSRSPVSPAPTAPVSAAKPALPVLQTPTPLLQRINSPTILAQTPTPQTIAQTQAPTPPTPTVPTVIPQPIVPAPAPDVLVPNPKITIDGVPAPATGAVQPVAPAPPFLPRAIAPPVGDIAISNINAAASTIDLGTGVRVPRLVLREAPVREVLALLARSAGLNLAFTGDSGARPAGAPGAAPAGAQQTISLDLEDEPVQDVFNYVLRISGLQANRVGRTIFVGSQLPDAARNIVARTLRLNQVPVGDAVGFLIGQGAEQQQITTQTSLTVVGEGAAAQRIENTTTSVQRITPQTQGQGQGVQGPSGPLVLRGLAVAADDRLNAITLVGEPRQVEIASALLTQLDLRRRQVAVNVKVVDVNLLGTDAFNSSFSFGIGDSFFVNDGGAASFNYGGYNPPSQLQVTGSTTSPPVITNPFAGANVFLDPNNVTSVQGTLPGTTIVDARTGSVFTGSQGAAVFNTPFVTLTDPLQPGFTNITPAKNDLITIDQNGNITVTPGTLGTATVGLPSLFRYPTRFLSALQAQITSGNAKILTDPTLVVQEGETATVNLTQEVVGNIRSETESTNNQTTRTVTAEIREAGLILEIAVSRIDDNGFISLAVNPRVTAIGSVQNLSVGQDTNQIALLNVRQLRSGQIRLRDSQTLILSGIIQETDRTTVSKVPILGDIPLLGALFRSTNRQNQRQEVIVLLTPQVLDDSAGSSFGYNYTPGRDARQVLQRQGVSP